MSKILCIDFDGTIVDHQYPAIGEMRPNAKAVINRLHDEGWFIIIWTCRCGDTLMTARSWLLQNKIWFDKLNENAPVEKRLPAIPEGSDDLFSPVVIVNYDTNQSAGPIMHTAFAYCDKKGNWHDAMAFKADILINFKPYGQNQVIEWYEEIEIESLFPKDKTSVMVAANASGKSFTKMLSHQEGQTYIQNYIIKKLKS